MAIAIAENPTTANNSTTTVVNLASAPQGDALIAIIGTKSGTLDPTISGSGWTSIVNVLETSRCRLKAWWKVAGASEPTAITFTHGGTVEAVGCIVRLDGAHSTTPWINDAESASGGVNTFIAPGTAGGSGSDMVVAAIYGTTSAASIVDPQDYTEIAVDVSANSMLFVLALEDTTSKTPAFEVDSSTYWTSFNSGWDAAAGTLLFRRRQMEAS